ncbi:hypothetical protein AAE250_11800 [Bacteroides sp. GD17]|jgi:hypothetical protein|uniref:hypothetical protein n=1 Tax=Bacteroides sp. GD17 TaxID=3139826 RepID=UPI00204BD6A1|nr:hypothetical protein [uncultured Bacteroides sp.]DAV44329.1 MAG TPA: tail protein [Caudoviricetes sp.]
MAGIINTGSPYVGSVKRTNPKSLDSSETHATKQQAHLYARNANGEDVPYPGQIISAEGQAYILKIDPEMPDESDKEIYHCYLDPLGGNNDNDDRYVRKDIAETIEKLMTFIEGINVKGTATLNEIILLNNIISKNFSPGGNGFGIYQDEDGNYHLDIDFVDIRKKLRVEEIQVQESTYIGGKQYNTGGGMICNRVEDMGTYWRCYFKTTDADGRTVYNTFQKDDQAICEVFNLKSGSHYYWRLLVGKGDDYIDLSKSDCATGSDAPLVGDSIVQLGNRTDISRQGAIVWDSVTAGGPYVRIYKGINSYTMPEPLIDFNTVLSEITAKFINEATGKDIDETIGDMQVNLDLIKQQTDKEYTLWYYDYEPTLSNLPASEWKTAELKAMHDQDMFYNRLTGKGYRFESGVWKEITDHLTLKALEDAAKAQDTADSKRRVFVAQPTAKDAYDVGDLWVNATYSDGTVTYKNDSLVCKTAKAAGAAFSISHWKPSSSATTAYIENLGDRITIAVTNSEDGIAAAKELARQGINDAYDAAQSALQALGIAQGAQSTADQNTAAIQVTKDSISALVEGIHINALGNITNIDTSGLVTTDDFNVLLSKKVNFDSGGHITNISTSGLVTEASFAQLFSEKAYADGYVKRAEISTFITEDQAGRLISNAVISAEQIRFNGNIVANDTFVVDENGKLTLNNITVNETGEFKGRVSIANKILLENDGSGSLASGNITWDDKGKAEFVGTIKSSSSSGGNYVVVGVEKQSSVPGAEDNGVKIYDEKGNQVGAFGYTTGFGISGAMGIALKDGDESVIINPRSLYLQSSSGSNIYSVEISPSSGIKFYENFNLTKTYSRK